MPQRRSGIKAIRINKRKRSHNLDIKTDLKKTIKAFQALAASEKVKEAQDALRTVYKKIDKAVKLNVLHKNTASRRKSGLTKLLSKKV